MAGERGTNRSFRLFIWFVFISVYAPVIVFSSADPNGYYGFLKSSGRKSFDWRKDERQTSMNTGENEKVVFYNGCRLIEATYYDSTENDQDNYTVLASTSRRLVSRNADPPRLQVGRGSGTNYGQAAQSPGLRREGGRMNYDERLNEQDAAALIGLLAETFKVKAPGVRFNARNRRGYYYPSKKLISLSRSVRVKTVVHEFAHYLDHVETGRSSGRQANDRECHSQGFYYKLRKVVRVCGGEYPWQQEYRQIARWAAGSVSDGE